VRAKNFYKNDIYVFSEFVYVPSPVSYENDHIRYVKSPAGQDIALLRGYFLERLRRLNIDLDALNFEVIYIKRQHYHMHSIFYNGAPINIEGEFFDHADFVVLRSAHMIAIGKKTTFSGALTFALTLYEMQPLKLVVAEFAAKNFSSNPTAFPGANPYVTGIYGMNQNGDVVFVSRFSQPVKLDEAYVFVQKILLPTYSYIPQAPPPPPSTTAIPPSFTTQNVNVSIYYPGITTSNPNVELYFPDITTQDVVISLGFFYDETPALLLNLHNGTEGEVGLLSPNGNYRLVSTTSIKFGGVAAYGYEIYWLDYFSAANTNTLSIKRLQLNGGYFEDYITFSNQGSITFNALLYDPLRNVFIVSANNGTYMVRKSPYLATFSSVFGSGSIYMDIFYSVSQLYYTDPNPVLKFGSYQTTSPYFFPPSNSSILTVSNLSYFTVMVSSSTQYFYITQSGSSIVLRSTENNLTFYSASQMGALVVDKDNLWNRSTNAVFFSALTGSSWGVFITPKDTVSVSLISTVSWFVRQIAPVVNFMPLSSYYLTSSASGVVFTESWDTGKINTTVLLDNTSPVDYNFSDKFKHAAMFFVENTAPVDNIFSDKFKHLASFFVENTAPVDDLMTQYFKQAALSTLSWGYPQLELTYTKYEL